MSGQGKNRRSSVSAIARIGAILALLGGASASHASADVLRVPEDYSTIQAAVDAAVAGDVIRVGPGTYRERVQISKSAIRLVAEPALAAVLDGSTFTTPGAAISVTGTMDSPVTNVAIVGFRIQKQMGRGIALQDTSLCEILSNTVTDTTLPNIALARSTYTVVAGNTLSNGQYGVGISMRSADNSVKDNTIIGAFEHGIRVSMTLMDPPPPLRNTIKDNLVCVENPTSVSGIFVTGSAAANIVQENKIVGNGVTTFGIWLDTLTRGNVVKGNILNATARDIKDDAPDDANAVTGNEQHRSLRCPRK